jgi:hypothetical protein
MSSGFVAMMISASFLAMFPKFFLFPPVSRGGPVSRIFETTLMGDQMAGNQESSSIVTGFFIGPFMGRGGREGPAISFSFSLSFSFFFSFSSLSFSLLLFFSFSAFSLSLCSLPETAIDW